MAATQAQQLREDNSAYRAQSSLHLTVVNQNDLRLQLNQRDLRQRINNCHHQCATAERERRRQYDKELFVQEADH